MAYASITYTSASGTTFALTNSSGDPIEYLRQADIYVYVNNVLKTLTTDYTFNTAGTAIVLNTAVSGATVTLERITAIAEPTVVYTAGSTLTAQDLNNADNQIRFGLQEFQDDVAGGQGVTDGDKGDITVTGTGTSWTVDSANSGNVVFSSNQIKSVSLGSAAAPTYSFNGDTNTGIFSPGADTLAFAEGGVEVFRYDSSGRVLIGTTSASGSNLLQVNSDVLVNSITVGRGASAVSSNTAVGTGTLQANTIGDSNVATGYQALYSNTTGQYNTANGYQALYSNVIGNNNTAYGLQALRVNTGNDNTAIGTAALSFNTSGINNTAIGYLSLLSNISGGSNTASGYQSLGSNTTGSDNTAIGRDSLLVNVSGSKNTAVGRDALLSNTGGSNTAVGLSALRANTSGSGNVAIGGLNSAGNYSPVFATTTQDNRVVVGSTSVTNAYVQVAWTVVSDARDKTNFAPIPHGLSFVNALKPTAFQFKVNRDLNEPNGPIRYGFLAQDILALEGDNNVIIDNENPEKLLYNGESLVPVLVNAVNELTAIVKNLQIELDALKSI